MPGAAQAITLNSARMAPELTGTWRCDERSLVLNVFQSQFLMSFGSGDRWEVSMGPYIDKVCKRFNLEDARREKTPMDAEFMITPQDIREDPNA